MAQRLGLNYEVRRPFYQEPLPFIGCARSHLHILRDAQAPCLVLEDDCEATDHFRPHPEVPDSADALALGMSRYGIPLSPPPRMPRRLSRQRGILDGAVTTQYNQTFLRAHNMLGGHAYLYMKQDAIAQVCEGIEDSLAIPWPWDVAMAQLQKQRLLVLTPRQPWFFQKFKTYLATYSETGLTPVANVDAIDDAWFKRRLDKELSQYKPLPRMRETAWFELQYGRLGQLLRKLS